MASCAACESEVSEGAETCPICGAHPTEPVIAGKYKLTELVGRGGMGTVHLAIDQSLDRTCAVKMLRPVFKGEPAIVQRLDKEARILARLEHPNVVPIYAVERFNGLPVIVMKYLEGKTLGKLRRERGRPWTAEEFTPIFKQLCAGLGFIHSKDVVHRDLKPGNLFVSPEGHVTILDMGISRTLDSTLTMPGLSLGTPHYMSPEQTITTQLDARSDLYSLGVIVFEALTGRLPFLAESAFEHMQAHRDAPVPNAADLAQVPPLIGTVLQRLMAKSPADRYQTARELSEAWSLALLPSLDDPVEQALKTTPMKSVLAAGRAGETTATNTPGGKLRPPAPVPAEEATGRSSPGLRPIGPPAPAAQATGRSSPGLKPIGLSTPTAEATAKSTPGLQSPLASPPHPRQVREAEQVTAQVPKPLMPSDVKKVPLAGQSKPSDSLTLFDEDESDPKSAKTNPARPQLLRVLAPGPVPLPQSTGKTVTATDAVAPSQTVESSVGLRPEEVAALLDATGDSSQTLDAVSMDGPELEPPRPDRTLGPEAQRPDDVQPQPQAHAQAQAGPPGQDLSHLHYAIGLGAAGLVLLLVLFALVFS